MLYLYNYSHCCVLQRPDEEVVVDQGGTSSVLNIHYEKEELEGEGRLYYLVIYWKFQPPISPQYLSPELRLSEIVTLSHDYSCNG